jgi:hypothetical protein
VEGDVLALDPLERLVVAGRCAGRAAQQDELERMDLAGLSPR